MFHQHISLLTEGTRSAAATQNMAPPNTVPATQSMPARYTEHAVNMRGAQICRLQHGFGQHKVRKCVLFLLPDFGGGGRGGST